MTTMDLSPQRPFRNSELPSEVRVEASLSFLFHEGESDAIDSGWPVDVRTLVVALRTELGIPNAPFLAGQLAYEGKSSSFNMLVNNLPNQISDTFLVSADGLALDPADTENVHFGHDAQVELGRRYARKMIEAHGW